MQLFNKISLNLPGIQDSAYLCYLELPNHQMLETYLDKVLSKNERAIYDSFTYPQRRFTYLLGRKCAKDLLAHFFKVNPHDVTITNNILGQPLIECVQLRNYRISISHSDNAAVVIVYPHQYPFGIDLEKIDQRTLMDINNYLTITEQQLIARHSEYDNLPFIFWSAREAAAKLLGCGIGLPVDVLRIKKIDRINEQLTLYFNNFFQFKAITSTLPNNCVLSLAMPVSVEMQVQDYFKSINQPASLIV